MDLTGLGLKFCKISEAVDNVASKNKTKFLLDEF